MSEDTKMVKNQVQISYSLVVLLKDYPFLMQNVKDKISVGFFGSPCLDEDLLEGYSRTGNNRKLLYSGWKRDNKKPRGHH